MTAADYELAVSARQAAEAIGKMRTGKKNIWFTGHWGFHYYLQKHQGTAVDVGRLQFRSGDLAVEPSNNTQVLKFGELAEPIEVIRLRTNAWVTTVNVRMGAGFHSSEFGPLPFVFGPVPAEEYQVVRIK